MIEIRPGMKIRLTDWRRGEHFLVFRVLDNGELYGAYENGMRDTLVNRHWLPFQENVAQEPLELSVGR